MNFEDQLREAAAEANRIIMSNLPEPSECVHEFSPKFERQLARMTRRAETPVRYFLQRAACAALLLGLILGAGVVVSTDAGARFRGWVKEQYDILVHYVFEGASSEEPMERKDYRLSYLPEGYAESTIREELSGRMLIYKNADDMAIRFHYTTNIENRNLHVDVENLVETTVQIQGKDAQIYEPVDDNAGPIIVWKNEDETVLFYVTGCVSTEELVKMAESVEQI